MSHFEENEGFIAKQIKSAFGHTKLYEIFGVEASATSSEIKKAYMKLALKHHPDKGGDSSTFQAISMTHSILSDEERRKLYDESGLLQSEEDLEGNEQSFEFWNEYFRGLFPKLTVQAIEKFAKEYIGSKEEEQHIISAYEKYDGNCVKMVDVIMFAEAGEEQRIVATIDRLIREGKLQATKSYEKNKKTLLKRYEQYLNDIVKEHVQGEDLDQSEEDEEEEEEETHPASSTANRKKRSNQKEKAQEVGGGSKRRKKKESGPSLEELILQKNQQRAGSGSGSGSSKDLFAKILSKYGDEEEMEQALEDPMSNEDFEQFQKTLFEKNTKDSLQTKASHNHNQSHSNSNSNTSSSKAKKK